MTVDLDAKIKEFVKANRKVWPEWPKEEKPRRRSLNRRYRDQVYLVGLHPFGSSMGYSTDTMVLLYDLEVLEVDNVMNVEVSPDNDDLYFTWEENYDLAGKEGVRLYSVTAKEARRLWQKRYKWTDLAEYDDDI